MYRFEELARRASPIGKQDVKLEVRFGAAHGKPRRLHSCALGARDFFQAVHALADRVLA